MNDSSGTVDNMASLEQYEAFVQTVQRGSLTAAARHLNRSPQSVSRALAVLEDELAIELVRRTTRRLHPTPAGLALYERLRLALRDIEDARAEAKRQPLASVACSGSELPPSSRRGSSSQPRLNSRTGSRKSKSTWCSATSPRT
ncbi:MAG: LysR family transcriptional regulator [Ramlibacter sp.]|nr:LysR family transcriptional regulator [Ramlibacter sp.]